MAWFFLISGLVSLLTLTLTISHVRCPGFGLDLTPIDLSLLAVLPMLTSLVGGAMQLGVSRWRQRFLNISAIVCGLAALAMLVAIFHGFRDE